MPATRLEQSFPSLGSLSTSLIKASSIQLLILQFPLQLTNSFCTCSVRRFIQVGLLVSVHSINSVCLLVRLFTRYSLSLFWHKMHDSFTSLKSFLNRLDLYSYLIRFYFIFLFVPSYWLFSIFLVKNTLKLVFVFFLVFGKCSFLFVSFWVKLYLSAH